MRLAVERREAQRPGEGPRKPSLRDARAPERDSHPRSGNRADCLRKAVCPRRADCPDRNGQ